MEEKKIKRNEARQFKTGQLLHPYRVNNKQISSTIDPNQFRIYQDDNPFLVKIVSIAKSGDEQGEPAYIPLSNIVGLA